MKLLLALSGGGFRATIFHQGVIRFLRDSGLLTNVAVISSVSGGSITAAHVVLNWRDYTGELDNFLLQETKVRDLTQFGLRNRLLRRDPFYTLRNYFRKDKYTITDRLRDYYEEELFGKDATLASLATAVRVHKAPTLFLMTTTLTRPTAVCYFEPGGFMLRDAIGRHPVSLGTYPVAAAVAASSAFPVLFPPMEISARTCDVFNIQFGLPAQYLTDGGVFENLGITALRDYAAEEYPFFPAPAGHGPWGGEPYYLVLSNAGAKLDWDLDTVYTQKRFRSMLRSVEIVQYWAEQRLRFGNDATEIVIDIGDSVNPPPQGYPSEAFQQQGARFRTDLDAFSDLEWDVLYDHGYSIARKMLGPVLLQYPPPPAPVPPGPPAPVPPGPPPVYNPWQGVADTSEEQSRLQKGPLTRARCRRWRPWVKMDGFSLLYGLIVLIFAGTIWFGWPVVWRMGESVVAGLRERARKDLGSGSIVFVEPKNADDTTTLHHQGLTLEARVMLKQQIERLRMSLPKDKELLLLEQEKAFEDDYGTQTRWLRFKGHARATSGVAYLIDTKPNLHDIGYREIRMPKHPAELELTGAVVIERPRSGEVLIFVLVVEPLKVGGPFPGTDTKVYEFKLENR